MLWCVPHGPAHRRGGSGRLGASTSARAPDRRHGRNSWSGIVTVRPRRSRWRSLVVLHLWCVWFLPFGPREPVCERPFYGRRCRWRIRGICRRRRGFCVCIARRGLRHRGGAPAVCGRDRLSGVAHERNSSRRAAGALWFRSFRAHRYPGGTPLGLSRLRVLPQSRASSDGDRTRRGVDGPRRRHSSGRPGLGRRICSCRPNRAAGSPCTGPWRDGGACGYLHVADSRDGRLSHLRRTDNPERGKRHPG